MNNLQVGVLVGSLRAASMNRKLAHALTNLGAPGISFYTIAIDGLPLYNPDQENAGIAQVLRLREEISRAHGILFVTPEYNRSIPSPLKTALDHASRPYGKSVWAGKPAGIIGASPGAAGTAMAQQHLRNVLTFLDMPTMSQPEAFIQVDAEFFDAQGGIAREHNREFLSGWLAKFAGWVRQHKSADI